MKISLARIKKALVAGAGAGLGAAVTYEVTVGFQFDADSVGKLVGAFFAAAVPVGYATFKAANAPGYGVAK